jgi:hypothetical protein
VREPGYREPRVALRPVLDAVRRCLEVPRPLRIGFLAAVFLAAARLLCLAIVSSSQPIPTSSSVSLLSLKFFSLTTLLAQKMSTYSFVWFLQPAFSLANYGTRDGANHGTDDRGTQRSPGHCSRVRGVLIFIFVVHVSLPKFWDMTLSLNCKEADSRVRR